ncbi:T9SS type A sorting domain-containing protein [Aurantibacillus circumpalustris]|uniref:T9SS type A sorting domain-containing protein n=1 Tax=Aurantibacillus circumpalustris TaxID=3036359 RepID=UPI00295A6214|nr:T9SS type A sorting domain-containing protein [Aurantibacillus circumpalustris]
MLSRIKTLISLTILSNICLAQIPQLNSSPAITNKVIYLDFDGQKVVGTGWNSGNLINAAPSTMNAANIILIWKRVSEDYRPFDVNITTDSIRFNNATPDKRIRVVFTPTSAWYGSAGGVAYVGSFAWGGTPGTPCWVFENQLSYNVKNMAEAAAHEVGHTLTLRHQSEYNSSCVKTAEYNNGFGNGVTSWAPIMGVGYSKNVTIWHTGQSATSCNTIQFDHGNSGIGITSPNFLSFLQDDVGDNFNTAKILNLTNLNLVDSGIITEPTDKDAYRFTICSNRYVSIGVKPWALDTTNYLGANLDVRLFLYDALSNVLAVDTPLSKLHSLVGLNLTPGTYYFTVDGGRSAYYNDYGSLGKYYVSIKATNPSALANTIVTATNICAGQNTTLNYSSNGLPTQWSWSVTGSSTNTYSTQNPSMAFTAGIYTISLLATSASSLSCPTTITLNIGATPAIALTNSVNVLCPGKTLTLTATGASSYTWNPGGFGGATQILTPLANSTFTIYGTNGTCLNSIVNTITVSPNFTFSSSVSNSSICAGETVAITSIGASNYTINPGSITTNPAVVSPVFPTSYFVIGEVGGCTKVNQVFVSVSQHFDIFLTISDTLICEGMPVSIISTGANNYTINPGGLIGYSVVVNPSTTTNYTILAEGNGVCIEDTSFTIHVKTCNLTGIRQNFNSDEIHIYPNPVKGNLNIFNEQIGGRIEIINISGQIIHSQTIEEKLSQVNTQNWVKGIYFAKVYSKKNILSVEKIIVE